MTSSYSIFTKLESLFKFAKLIFLVRQEEETRGGEYIEFAYGVAKYSDKFYFFARDSIVLSTMVLELIKRYNVQMPHYRDSEDLALQAIEIIRKEMK